MLFAFARLGFLAHLALEKAASNIVLSQKSLPFSWAHGHSTLNLIIAHPHRMILWEVDSLGKIGNQWLRTASCVQCLDRWWIQAKEVTVVINPDGCSLSRENQCVLVLNLSTGRGYHHPLECTCETYASSLFPICSSPCLFCFATWWLWSSWMECVQCMAASFCNVL